MRRKASGLRRRLVVEAAHLHALLAQQVEIDIGHARIWLADGKRSVSASVAPFSKIEAWPSQARSVVDSPAPAAAYR